MDLLRKPAKHLEMKFRELNDLDRDILTRKVKKMKTHSLEDLTDRYIGKKGTTERDEFENELRLDLLGYAIKQARKERNLTQEQLGELVGVKRAQISKIENSATDARFSTILKVFKVLGATVKFDVKLDNRAQVH